MISKKRKVCGMFVFPHAKTEISAGKVFCLEDIPSNHGFVDFFTRFFVLVLISFYEMYSHDNYKYVFFV